MKPAPFDYRAPGSLAETLAVLGEHGDAAKPLAGGQSLVPMLAMRLVRPQVLVSLKRLGELDYIRRENGTLLVGAMTRQWRVEESAEVARACPLLAEAIRYVGHPTIRSRGTVGGSIAHADPAAELPAVLVALDGRVRLQSSRGARVVPAADFFQGMMATALRPAELLVEVQFPAVGGPGDRCGHAFVEVSRRHGDFAMAGAVAALALDAGGTVTDARIALTGVENRPRRRAEAEAALRGQRWRPERLGEVAALAAGGLEPLDDLHAPAGLRAQMARVLTERALGEAYRRAGGGGEGRR
jgi:CO/xanthine dehydrogenase FAD-binding subunit